MTGQNVHNISVKIDEFGRKTWDSIPRVQLASMVYGRECKLRLQKIEACKHAKIKRLGEWTALVGASEERLAKYSIYHLPFANRDRSAARTESYILATGAVVATYIRFKALPVDAIPAYHGHL